MWRGNAAWTQVRSWEGLGACSMLGPLVRSDGQTLFGTPAWGTSAGRSKVPLAVRELLPWSLPRSVNAVRSCWEPLRGCQPATKPGCISEMVLRGFGAKARSLWLCCLCWPPYPLPALSQATSTPALFCTYRSSPCSLGHVCLKALGARLPQVVTAERPYFKN